MLDNSVSSATLKAPTICVGLCSSLKFFMNISDSCVEGVPTTELPVAVVAFFELGVWRFI